MIITLFGQLYGQSSFSTISGKVIDESSEPVAFANVAIYSNSDSSLLKGNVTDLDGKFSLDVIQGNYYLKITYLSYQAKIIGNINLGSADIKLGNISLEQGSLNLETVLEVFSSTNNCMMYTD